MKLDGELGNNSEVAATAAQRPEKIAMVLGVSANDGTVGGHHGEALYVVARQTV